MSDSRIKMANQVLFGSAAGTTLGRSARDAEKMSKRDREQINMREAAMKAEADKTARLRALRLAKEAEDAARAEEARQAKASSATRRSAKLAAKRDVAPTTAHDD